MTPERWHQIEDLFQRALERPPAERAAFLAASCSGDQELRREVGALLGSFEQAGDFIESPAFEGILDTKPHLTSPVATLATPEPKLATGGQHIGPYQILSLLGTGGMGEVYLAVDTRLGRQIALKLLPTQFTTDQERVLRFEREARAASALNHPNIITIHEIGRIDVLHFIATEYIPGQTLRQKLVGDTLSPSEALDIALQIAGALSAAHAAGIIHRDIKPENIMVRPDGLVKILDFGLAKSIELDPGKTNELSPGTPKLRTDPGMIMGTVAYMSPEQALAQPADRQSDIFSLGVVLYEMVTGKRPFDGKNPALVLDAIINTAPDPVSVVRPGLPPELGRLINRTLEKNRAARYQTAEALRADLKRLRRKLGGTSDLTETAAVAVRVARGGRAAWAALALGVATLLAVGGFWLTRSVGETGESASSWNRAVRTQLTHEPGEEVSPSLAVDGQSFVYASRAEGNWDIYWQSLDGSAVRNLTRSSAADDLHPALSPDREWIAFRSERDGGGIFVMKTEGGSVRRLTEVGHHPAWSPDGAEILCTETRIFMPGERRVTPWTLWAVKVATGERRVISTDDVVQPSWSPHGQRIAYWGNRQNAQRDIWTMAADGSNPVPVTDDEHVDWNPIWSPDGSSLYFASNRQGSMGLWRVAIDERSGKVLGSPESVPTPATFSQHPSLSRDGKRLIYSQVIQYKNIHRIAFDPNRGTITGASSAITQGSRWALDVSLSPDGEWAVFSNSGEKQEDLYLIKSDGSGERRALTRDSYKDRGPKWSPDGSRIVFYSNRGSNWDLWSIKPDGHELKQVTFVSPADAFIPVWSADGSRLIYSTRSGIPYVIEMAKTWAEQKPQPITSPSAPQPWYWPVSWSPDGRKLIGGWKRSAESTVGGIASYSFETRQFERVLDSSSSPTSWLNDSRRVLFAVNDKIFLFDSQTRRASEIFSAAPHRITQFTLSPDQRWLYYSLEVTEADVWLLSLDQ